MASSELVSLRRENIQLRKKVAHVKSLETQNALLHLSVARAEQENITLKDAVVILQRKLSEHEQKTLKQANLISECTRGVMANSNNINNSRRSDNSYNGIAHGSGGRMSMESVSSAGLSLSPQLTYDTAASRRNASPPQLRRSSAASLSPPDYAAVLHNSKLYERRRSASPPPHHQQPHSGAMSSLLHTPPKRVFASASLRHTPPRTTTGAGRSSTLSCSPPQRGNLAMDDVEVSAVSSLFSPMSAFGAGGCSTPISPRRRAPPSPVPHTTPRWQLSGKYVLATTDSNSQPHAASSSSSLPVAATRAANRSASTSPQRRDTSPSAAATSPPLAPKTLVGKPPHGRPSRDVSPSRGGRGGGSLRSPILSRTSSMGSLSLSIDEELNEGIQRRLASLTFC